MDFFTRTLITSIFFITTMGLGACDNNSEKANNIVSPENSAASPAAAENAAEVISITKAHIRATAPGQKGSGAFMTLANASSTPYALTSVSFNAAGMVELHETSMNGKMMQMRRISQIDIPANGSVELKPGSYHVMLMGLDKGLIAGTTETLTLTFSDNSQKTVEASVGDLSD